MSLAPKSFAELYGVHPKLVRAVVTASEECPQPFAVHDGLRTDDEQSALVRAGASLTLNSKHLKQADGFGHAVDLVPLINNKLRWEWQPIYVIAKTMHEVCERYKLDVVWGGVWDRPFTDLDRNNLPAEVEAYRARELARRKRAGKEPAVLLDGPHFQLMEGL